jgi:hypothetical protein
MVGGATGDNKKSRKQIGESFHITDYKHLARYAFSSNPPNNIFSPKMTIFAFEKGAQCSYRPQKWDSSSENTPKMRLSSQILGQ